MEIKQCIMTNSLCYKQAGRVPEHFGIVVHSTGVNQPRISRYVQPSDNDPNRDEIIADIEKDQIVEDFLAYVNAVTVTPAANEGGSTPSPSTPPAEGTSSFYDYITNGRNAAIAQRYREFYAPDTGRYNCFDERKQDGDTMTFTLYALNSQTNELILCAEATKEAERVLDNGAVQQGTVTLKYCLSRKP